MDWIPEYSVQVVRKYGMTEEKLKNKVLVVDDNPANVDLITSQLENEYKISTAYGGKEAFEKILSEKPDIILLDVMMPEINGYEVCKKIKQDDSTRFIPVVMVTALSELDHKIRAMEAGADDFLIKPVNSIEIIARVRSLLKVKYFHDQLVKTKEKIEAQNDFKTVMANILPILLQNIPPDKKTELIMEMGKQVEEVIWEKYIHEQPGNSKEAAQVSCNIMNRLGGCFTIKELNEKQYTILNKDCPWGEYGKINPVLCMLTKAIFARIAIRVFENINVEMKKTIAGGDGYCLTEIFVGNY